MDTFRQNCTKLTPRQIYSLPLIVSSKSFVEAARKCGVSRSTLYGWLRQEKFVEAYVGMLENMIETGMKEMESQVKQVLAQMSSLLHSKNELLSLRAASAFIDIWFKMKERAKGQ